MNNETQTRHVIHETRYEYEFPAECSHQICVLQPQETAYSGAGLLRRGQRLINHSLKIQPNPSTLASHVDSMGNVVTHFEINYPHDQLVVLSQSEVEVTPMFAEYLSNDVSGPAWDELVRSFAYTPGFPADSEGRFRFASRHVPVENSLKDFGRLDFWPGRPVAQAGFALMQRIFREFRYVSGSTSIQTTVREVMETRTGVCQDFAHVMLATLRSLGLSARYVSGYMLTDPPPGQTKLMGADASHAWVSLWCGPDTGWVDFDPTNNQLPDLRYVTVAAGRDYADVPPLRGVVHGGGEAKLKVGVTVL